MPDCRLHGCLSPSAGGSFLKELFEDALVFCVFVLSAQVSGCQWGLRRGHGGRGVPGQRSLWKIYSNKHTHATQHK